MAEYIERDSFLKLISHKPSCPTTDREDRLINGFISAVKNFPAADVVEVARCFNCKYWNPRYNKSYNGHFCEVTTEYVTEHDYCSFGRRGREDGD